MAAPERFLELAAELIGNDAAQRARRSYKRRIRGLLKAVKVAGLMLLAAIVIPVIAITTGFFLGPRGIEGVIATPLAVLVTWAGILFWAMRTRATPRTIAKADIARLPAHTDAWLEDQRFTLPENAERHLDSIALQLAALGPQVRALDPASAEAVEVRRLLGEELPDLVRGYQKVPEAFRAKPLHGGPSPDQRLIEGLATIDGELARLHARLAEGDLRMLATQQRYLELKYRGGGGDERE